MQVKGSIINSMGLEVVRCCFDYMFQIIALEHLLNWTDDADHHLSICILNLWTNHAGFYNIETYPKWIYEKLVSLVYIILDEYFVKVFFELLTYSC